MPFRWRGSHIDDRHFLPDNFCLLCRIQAVPPFAACRFFFFVIAVPNRSLANRKAIPHHSLALLHFCFRTVILRIGKLFHQSLMAKFHAVVSCQHALLLGGAHLHDGETVCLPRNLRRRGSPCSEYLVPCVARQRVLPSPLLPSPSSAPDFAFSAREASRAAFIWEMYSCGPTIL